jgi:hypothetical protein
MPAAKDLVSAAYDYLAGRLDFRELYALAVEVDPSLFFEDAESFPARLSGLVLHAKALQDDGLMSPEEIRSEVMEILKDEALLHMQEAGARR